MKDHRHPAEVLENIVDHVFFFGERVCASPSHPWEYSNTDYTLPKIKISKISILFAYACIYMNVFISICECNNNQK